MLLQVVPSDLYQPQKPLFRNRKPSRRETTRCILQVLTCASEFLLLSDLKYNINWFLSTAYVRGGKSDEKGVGSRRQPFGGPSTRKDHQRLRRVYLRWA